MTSGIGPMAEIACWNAATACEAFTYSELSVAAGVSHETTQRIVRAWRQQGIVQQIDRGERRRFRFKVVNAIKRKPIEIVQHEREKRRQTPTGNMWTAIRGLGTVSPIDVAAHARTDEVRIDDAEARSYCQVLAKAGYLRIVRKAVPGRREAMYRLVRNTGPLPPTERRITCVYDPNEEAFAYIPGVTTP